MALATWWRNDPLPDLSPWPGFSVVAMTDDSLMAGLNRLSVEEVRTRRAQGHRPYVAYVYNAPVAYGWVATRQATIGELRLAFAIPKGNRYLWDFATSPWWQGRGMYPRLLQTILRREMGAASRFWIIHAPENLPSGKGIGKAGFSAVGQLSFQRDGSVGLAPYEGSQAVERAAIGGQMLGVPLVNTALAPCWNRGAVDPRRTTAVAGIQLWPRTRAEARRSTRTLEIRLSTT